MLRWVWELLKVYPVCVNKKYISGFGVKREKGEKGWRRDIIRAKTRQQHIDTGRCTHIPYTHTVSLQVGTSTGAVIWDDWTRPV